jgi:KaiC/GvpD/RAD55 family RecA-like ATPase
MVSTNCSTNIQQGFDILLRSCSYILREHSDRFITFESCSFTYWSIQENITMRQCFYMLTTWWYKSSCIAILYVVSAYCIYLQWKDAAFQIATISIGKFKALCHIT